MKKLFLITILFCLFNVCAQHTFSIVAVDSITGEIGSAGATCGDSIIWPGTPGAFIISDILPGVGAIHSQAWYIATNQNNARFRMQQGDNPEEIINWLINNDIQGNPSMRQYGIIDYNNGSPRSAGYTGNSCDNYKNHVLGPNYAIQGNILLGQEILDSMEYYFNNTNGCMADRMMAAMQGANVIGADTRCMSEGTSSLSAFIRVAQPLDNYNDLYLDINIAGTASGIEPIDELQIKYDQWKQNNNACDTNSTYLEISKKNTALLHPNPAEDFISVEMKINKNQSNNNYKIFDLTGKIVNYGRMGVNEEKITIEHLNNGLYYLKINGETFRFIKRK